MNDPLIQRLPADATLTAQIDAAAASIAPTWPLESFIAVNPYWGWRDQPVADAAAALGVLAGTRLTAPRSVFHRAWMSGHLRTEDLEAALDAAPPDAPGVDRPTRVTALKAALEAAADHADDAADPAMPSRLPLITDLCDAAGSPGLGQSWTGMATHQISQHAAAFFDRGQALWQMPTDDGLWSTWRQQLQSDHGLRWPRGHAVMAARIQALPATPTAAIATMLADLQVPQAAHADYLKAVLMAMQGWASWCAQLRWQSTLEGHAPAADADVSTHLLAVRLAWEWLLADSALPLVDWRQRWAAVSARRRAMQDEQALDWVLQTALEFGHQRAVADRLRAVAAATASRPGVAGLQPAVQAVFCIDVRSEIFRRALERVAGPALQTGGFAGFFGLPLAYVPLGGARARPQLPGLLSPTLVVTDESGTQREADGRDRSRPLGQVLAARRRTGFGLKALWHEFAYAPASIFSFVESMGLAYGGKLLLQSLPSSDRGSADGLPGATGSAIAGAGPFADRSPRPRLPPSQLGDADTAAMVAGILRAMGLARDVAPLVLLVGHGSQSANNPHASGLDCGACGGQSGEVNARVLADLLNRDGVRDGLRSHGIDIPAGTLFVPALHNTTTDEVQWFDTESRGSDAAAGPSLGPRKTAQGQLARLRDWLDRAGAAARAERAAALGLDPHADARQLTVALRQRARDWSQVRPEWGLADNATLIVGPRSRSRGVDLGGRSFLHDYDWRQDADGSVLTLIMTAPMVVTNWINLQYHASTLDNRRYGSGDKVLHNVVGHGVGVFEGNGGDLRIGLPMQSLHDGRQWRHTPLRLSVLIEAPRAMIEAVMARHAVVQQLVGHGWLHLLRIDGPMAASTAAAAVPDLRVERWLPASNDWAVVEGVSDTVPSLPADRRHPDAVH